MKLKKIFALALAVCMMVSAMPTTLAADGVLTSGGTSGSGDGVLTSGGSSSLTLTSGGSTVSRTTSGSVQPRQDGVLYSTGSGTEGGTTPVADPVDAPVIIDTTTYSETNTANGYKGGGDSGAPTSRKDVDGLFTSKTVTKKNDSTYTVRLEAYTDGTSGTYTSAVPADIVLVLEESAKMTETIYKYTPVYGENVKTNAGPYYVVANGSYVAVTWCNNLHTITGGLGFNSGAWGTGIHWLFHWGSVYEPICEDSKKSYYDDVVGYNWIDFSGQTVQFYERTPVKITRQEALKTAAEKFVSDVYKDAVANDVAHRVAVVNFADSATTEIGLVDDIRNNKDDVVDSIDTLESSGGCDVADGLAEAKAALDAADGTGRTRVIVVYTDGIPSAAETWDQTAESNASSAIGTAATLKSSSYGALIYTVGLGENVDPSLDIDDSELSDENKQEDSFKTNAFLHRVSSNFPNASSLTNGGSGGSITKGYYIGANDTESLQGIFKKVTNSFETPNVSLDANAEIKDTVSKYFNLNTASVKVYTANYSNGTFAERAAWNDVTNAMTVSKVDNTVAVKGFNYNSHFVGGSAPKKLIVEFDITVKSGFMGGNNVPTNNATAGVYVGPALIENFTYPLVNVSIPKPVVEVEGEQVIYYGETAPAIADLYTKITPTETDAWKYDFVKLTYTVPEGINNDDCATYDFKLNVQPIASATTDVGTPAVAIDSDVAQVKVHVLKAVLDAEDDTIYLGATTNLNELVSHSWACDCEEDQVTRADTSADPDVDYVFSGVASSIEGAYAPADHDCEDITVTCNRGNDSDEFTVHVVKPVFTNTDTTIYLGNTTDLNDRMFEADKWICDGTCGDQQSLGHSKLEDGEMVRVAPAVTYTFTGTNVDEDGVADPEDCTTYKSETSVGGVPVKQKDEQVIVHVLKPQLSVSDAYIYQGQTTGLDNRISVCEKASWIDTKNDGTSSNIEGEPDMDGFVYTFTDVKSKDAYTTDTCTPITVATAKINGKDVMTYFEDTDDDGRPNTGFIIHVLKPHFTVTTTDLWADYGTEVDLYMGGENYSAIDAVTGVSHTWVYNGDCTGDNVHPAERPNGAPEITLKDVIFAEGATHTMGAVDGKVTVSGLKYTNKEIVNEETDQLIEQTASLDDVAISYVDDKGYVALFVNKFDLTINKSWLDGEKVADGTYQQDAIFTVAHGQDTFKVVLPAGQPNVKVTGLLCGQDYTVTEDTAWTWRWESDDAKTVAAKTTKHEVSASDPHGEETDHIEKVSFTNSLKERIGKLWLSFCTMVANIFQKGGSF